MKKQFSFLTAVIVTAGLISFTGVQYAGATVVIGFTNADSFDGDIVGSTAGPFTDPASGLVGTITTTAITPGASLVNTVSGQLGINGPGVDTADGFDSGESWAFEWDQDSELVGMDFGSYSTFTENSAFAIQSAAWIGLSITPGSANVTYVSATGRFTFAESTASDIFTVTDLYGGGSIPMISAGTDITISFSPTAADNANIQSMSFNIPAVPEPSTVALFVGGLLALGFWRVKR